MGETLWFNDIKVLNETVIASSALVENGEFLVGIYTRPDNAKALNARSLKALQSLSFVSNRNWEIDWATLQQMAVKKLYSSNDFDRTVNMIAAGRADAMLSSFAPREDLIHQVNDHTLVPIPEVRITLAGSKHYSLSRNHPQSAAVLAALERGLTLLRAEGKIEQAYRESGFYHPKTQTWPILNSKTSDNRH